jgi:glycosyl transferase family 25
MRLFLATGESHALIGEDDISLGPDFDGVLQAAMDHSGSWNILRLTGLSARLPLKVAPLTNHYSLSINLGRTKGAGAYVLDRRAAETLLTRLLPMRLPFDHAIDREWFFGLRSLAVHPFPGSQVEGDFLSTVQRGTFPKFAESRRLMTVYPYQFVNETLRLWFRGGRYLWARMRG